MAISAATSAKLSEARRREWANGTRKARVSGKVCSVEACEAEYHARGYCKKHYNSLLPDVKSKRNAECREYMRLKYLADPKAAYARKMKSRAVNPERTRELERAGARRSYLKHREQRLASGRACRLRDPEKLKAKKKQDYKKHKAAYIGRAAQRRALLISSTVGDCTQKLALLAKTYFCRWCYDLIDDSNRAIDHIIPLSRGGLHTPDNLAATCRACNSSKSNKPLSEWLPKLRGVY